MAEFDPQVVELILGPLVGGVTVKGAMAWIKKKFSIKKNLPTYLVSLVVCAVATAIYLVPTGFVWAEFYLYTALVFAGANGIYRATKKTN